MNYLKFPPRNLGGYWVVIRDTEREIGRDNGKVVNADGDTTDKDCDQCGGSGAYVPDEPTDDQMDEWRSEVEDALSVLDNSPA